MADYYYLYNARTPFDADSLKVLAALEDYRISLPIEASGPGIEPVPQAEMVRNGVVGIYTTLEAVVRKEVEPHLPFGLDIPADHWLVRRPRIDQFPLTAETV